MGFFDKMVKHLEVASRYRVLAELKALRPEQLEDAGISPDLLRQGVSAWPWRVDNTVASTERLILTETDVSASTTSVTGHTGLSAANSAAKATKTVEFDSAA